MKFSRNMLGLRLAGLIVFAILSTASADEPDYLILAKIGDGPMIVEGQKKWINRAMPPASTFKTALAWAALEEKIIRPHEEKPWDNGKTMTLQQALFVSNNPFFVELAKGLSREKLAAYIDLSGLFDPEHASWDNPDDPASIVRGNQALTTPSRLFAFTEKIAAGTLCSTPEVQAELDASLLRDDYFEGVKPAPFDRFHAKTGTYGGALWVTGYGFKGDTKLVATILMTYEVPHWQERRKIALARYQSSCQKYIQDAQKNHGPSTAR